MVFSRRLIAMVAAGAPMLLAGAMFDPLLAVGVLYLTGLTLYLVVDAVLLPKRGRIWVERQVPDRLSLGVATRVELAVRSACRRPVQVQLAEDLPPHLAAEPASVSVRVRPRGGASVSYRLTAFRRGRYDLSELDVRVRPAGGLLCRQFRLSRKDRIDVFPNLGNVKRYELLLRRGSTEEGRARLRRIGQGSEFESLRPYVVGDDSSRVDWKATAKYSRLVVKNFEPERQQSVVLAIDTGRATAGEFMGLSRLDYFVNAALMLAYVVLRQGDWFSLLAFSDRIQSYLPPVRQAKNIERVARALYELKTNLIEPDYEGAFRFLALNRRKRSLVCLMTDVIDAEASSVIVRHMIRFARYHLPLLVTLDDRDVRRLAEARLSAGADLYSQAVALDVLAAREEALTAMRHRGVSVLNVAPTALTPDLINRYLSIKLSHLL